MHDSGFLLLPTVADKQQLYFSAPSKPEIGGVDVADTSANVSWVPSGKEEPGNPGSKFYLQYREKDDHPGQFPFYNCALIGERTAGNSQTIEGRPTPSLAHLGKQY